MKAFKVLSISCLVIIIGYALYLAVGMSSIYASIKEYSFNVNKTTFEQKLTKRISALKDWSLERKDTINADSEICYSILLHRKTNGHNVEYAIRYCSTNDNACIRLNIIGAFDLSKKIGGYKSSDEGVEGLVAALESTILNDFESPCSGTP